MRAAVLRGFGFLEWKFGSFRWTLGEGEMAKEERQRMEEAVQMGPGKLMGRPRGRKVLGEAVCEYITLNCEAGEQLELTNE